MSGLSEEDVVRSFFLSAEYQQRQAGLAYVAELYRDVLSREADAAELSAGMQVIADHGAEALVEALVQSDASYLRIIDGYYASLLHRAGEEGGRGYWLDQVRSAGLNARSLAERFLASREYYERAQDAVP